jgi:hypothetical protein
VRAHRDVEGVGGERELRQEPVDDVHVAVAQPRCLLPQVVPQVPDRLAGVDDASERRHREPEAPGARADVEDGLVGEIRQAQELVRVPAQKRQGVVGGRVERVEEPVLHRVQDRDLVPSHLLRRTVSRLTGQQLVDPGRDLRTLAPDAVRDRGVVPQRDGEALDDLVPHDQPLQLEPLEERHRIERNVGYVEPAEGHRRR